MNIRPEAKINELNDEQRYRLLVASVRDYAIYMLDAQGYVSSWNAGAERFKGYRADEIIGRHFSEFYTPEERTAGVPMTALRTALIEGKFESEGWRVRKDGTRFWASVVIDPVRNDAGEVIGFAKVTRDITERKISQQALRESEERFRLLVQGVTDYAIYMLSPTGIVTNWNAGAERIKGYSADEIVGSHFSRFYTDEDREAGLPERSLITAAKEGRFEYEGWRVRKNGEQFRAHVVIDAIHNDMGELLGFAKITRDITEKMRADEALAQANAALFQAQKMEAIGQLTGGVAHDFNNLLAVLGNGLDILTLRSGAQSDTKLLASMRRAVERGAALTQQLLSFARRQPLQIERCDLNALIRSFDAVLQRAGHSAIAFEMRLASHLCPVEVDAARFEASLLNLVVNARDAMPEGGTLTVSTENVELANGQVGRLAAGRYVKVSVADTGTGMEPEVVARAFEPFFTTKEVGKGTGLGLSQVYGFIAQSGGEVIVESEVGAGTTVAMYLPALQGEPDAESGDEQPRLGAKATVLVVDDEPDVLEAAAELFRNLGYDVLTASSAREASAILQARADIGVLFSDVIMPGTTGVELAHLARSLVPTIKVVLVSGYPLPALRAVHGGLEDFTLLNKPYRVADLVDTLAA